jgi:hypothetical protein
MRELSGRALRAWEAFVSVFGHGTAVVLGQGHVSCRRIVSLAPILPTQACNICVAASAGLRLRHECYGGQVTWSASPRPIDDQMRLAGTRAAEAPAHSSPTLIAESGRHSGGRRAKSRLIAGSVQELRLWP